MNEKNISDINSGNIAAAKPVPRKGKDVREAFGERFEDPYEWMRNKESKELKDYVDAQNAYYRSKVTHLKNLAVSIYDDFLSEIDQTDNSVPVRNHDYWYFAREKEITVFDEPVMAYIYIDQYNALKLYTDYRMKNPDVFEKLPMKEQNWYKVKFGYFVLLSNQRKTAAAILDDYFGRSSIETFFKSSKEYLKLLPLCKWTDERVRGKILSDIIDQIIRSEMMRMRKNNTQSISEIIGKTQSLMCSWDSENDEFVIDQPNRQVKDIFKMFRIPVPQQLNYTDYRHMIYV